MRIVQIVVGIKAEASGPSYSVPMLAKELKAEGCDIDLLTLSCAREHGFPFSVSVFPRKRFPIYSLGRSPQMLRELKIRARYTDIFHVNALWMMPCIYPSSAIRYAKRQGGHVPKLVTSPRGSLAAWSLRKGWVKKKMFGCFFQNNSLALTDMFHATSEKEYEEIRAAGYNQPVAIVPIGMDVPEVKALKRGQELRKIVFFGRLHKVKGVDRLLLAWERVACSGWELVIAGPDCGMLEALKGIVAERKLPRVSFVGEINGHEKYEFLAGADIYVLPSDTENFGVTVAEALACGTPVVASQGTPWQGLETEGCGRWVPIGVEPLVVALKELMSLDDAGRFSMGVMGKKWILRDFSWQGVGVKMMAAYKWLWGQGDRPDCVVEN